MRLCAALVIAAVVAGCAESTPPEPTVPQPVTEAEILGALERLNTLVPRKDMAVTNEFAPEADVVILGSEAGELATGTEQIRGHFEKMFAQPVTVSWDWKETHASSLGDVAWILAIGDAVVKTDQGEMRVPYRLTGVLQRRDGTWKWRQFHGSEPAGPR